MNIGDVEFSVILWFLGLALLLLPGLASRDKEERGALIGCGCVLTIVYALFWALLVLAADRFALPFWAALVFGFAIALSYIGASMLIVVLWTLGYLFFTSAYRLLTSAYRRFRRQASGRREPVAPDHSGDSSPTRLSANESRPPAS